MSIPQKALLVFLLCALQAFAATVYVGGTGSCQGNPAFTSIQDAIGASQDGDSILVCPGSDYPENVVVNKSVNIYGRSSADPAVIAASVPSNPALTVESDRVNISNFILKDATGSYGLYSTASHGTFENISSTNNDIGFYLYSGSNNRLHSNTAHDNFDEGFRLSYSDHNLLEDNEAYGQLYYGFYLVESSDNTLMSNTAHDSYLWYGFFLYTGATGNLLLNNTANSNGHHGFHVYLNSDNNFTGNAAYDNAEEGFRFSSTSGNFVSENEAYSNLLNGFLISSSTDNEFIGNTAHDNSQYGFHLHQGTGNILDSNEAFNQEDGFRLFGSFSNTLSSNTAYQNQNGFYLDISSDNALVSNIAHDNEEHGFLLSSSSDNNVSDNLAYDNGLYGFYSYLSSQNSLEGNDAHRNSDGIRISSSTENDLIGNDAHDNLGDGINLYSSGHNTISDNHAGSNGRHGIYLYESPNNDLMSNEAWENDHGIKVYLSPNNELDGNSAHDNDLGVLISSSPGSRLNMNQVSANSLHGIHILLSPNCRLAGDVIDGNGVYGAYVQSSTNVRLEDEHYYANAADFSVNASTSLRLIASGMVFDNPSGDYSSYSNISITDRLLPNSSYVISWAAQPDALPYPQMSFEGKYLDISAEPPGTSIDSISWHWLDSEAGSGYDESEFRLWQHDAAGWQLLDAVPDERSNTITMEDLIPASVYGILQNQSLPGFDLHYPLEGDSINLTDVDLSWTVSSSDPSLPCDILLDGHKSNPHPLSVSSGTPASYHVNLEEGGHSWKVSCSDSVGTNTSQAISFEVDLPPVVSLESTEDVLSNSTAFELVFSADDSSDSVDCTLLMDGISQATKAIPADSTPQSFMISDPDEGHHSLQVICEDEAGNLGASETKDATFDRTPPALALISPEDGYLGSDSSLDFVFSATDELAVISYLYIDGFLEGSTSGGQITASPGAGEHEWHIVSTDAAGNSAESETRGFTIDRSPPVITVHSPQHPTNIISSQPEDVDFDFTATDDHSETVDCVFDLDGDETDHTVGSEHITFTRELEPGTHQYWIICTDEVSNSRTTPIRTIYIGSEPEHDEDDDDPDPEILLTNKSDCYGNMVTIHASSGSGTFIRLIDPDGILLGSGDSDPNGEAEFAVPGPGYYQARATKSNYRPGTLDFYHGACQSHDDGDTQSVADDNDDPPAEVDEQPVPSAPEPEMPPPEYDDTEPQEPASEPDVDLLVDDVAYQGDDVEVEVYVDGEPAEVLLRVASPDGGQTYFRTGDDGTASFNAKDEGNYSIIVVEGGLPQEVAYVEVKGISSSTDPREAFSLMICIPCLLPLILAFLLMYYAFRDKKRKRRYSGYRKEEGFSSRIGKILKRKPFGK